MYNFSLNWFSWVVQYMYKLRDLFLCLIFFYYFSKISKNIYFLTVASNSIFGLARPWPDYFLKIGQDPGAYLRFYYSKLKFVFMFLPNCYIVYYTFYSRFQLLFKSVMPPVEYILVHVYLYIIF